MEIEITLSHAWIQPLQWLDSCKADWSDRTIATTSKFDQLFRTDAWLSQLREHTGPIGFHHESRKIVLRRPGIGLGVFSVEGRIDRFLLTTADINSETRGERCLKVSSADSPRFQIWWQIRGENIGANDLFLKGGKEVSPTPFRPFDTSNLILFAYFCNRDDWL